MLYGIIDLRYFLFKCAGVLLLSADNCLSTCVRVCHLFAGSCALPDESGGHYGHHFA